MQYAVNKAKGNTYKIDVKVPKDTVNKAFSEALEHEKEHVKMDGFRRGKAPSELVKDKIDKSALSSHAINHLLSDIYSILVKENKYQPITNPIFNVKSFDEDKDLDLEVIIVEKPDIKIGDYKAEIKKINLDKTEDRTNKVSTVTDVLNKKLIEAVGKVTEFELSDSLVEMERDRMLSNLIDQTARLGLTVDQYLDSQKKTIEGIKKEYSDIASSILHSDFALTEVAAIEGVTVSDDEINATIAAVPDEKSREVLSKPEQKVYIKAVLRKSKTLEQLRKYVENESNISN